MDKNKNNINRNKRDDEIIKDIRDAVILNAAGLYNFKNLEQDTIQDIIDEEEDTRLK